MDKVEEKVQFKAYKKLGFSALEMAEIVNNLNVVLANMQVHKQKLQQYHWNVKGGDFFELHELFENQYNDVAKTVDDVAERIRVFGKYPIGTLEEYLKLSEIKASRKEKSSVEMVRDILSDYDVILSTLVDTLNASNKLGDAGTTHLMNSLILDLEKKHWMMTSWLMQDIPMNNLS